MYTGDTESIATKSTGKSKSKKRRRELAGPANLPTSDELEDDETTKAVTKAKSIFLGKAFSQGQFFYHRKSKNTPLLESLAIAALAEAQSASRSYHYLHFSYHRAETAIFRYCGYDYHNQI